ncbi:putative holin [Pseudomonas gelidaquae]|uniref:putative holin n=1 Tax=Pseudomonas sp. IB20 TaxID=1702250 RepID=UPI0012D31C31|nr:putative holin [Pseudomonas sp. IB20]
MADPTSSVVTGLLIGLGLSTVTPVIDDGALFGAILGAWLVTSTKRDLKVWQRLGSLFLSAGVGYLFAPMVCALVVIPISIKLMVWVEKADIWDIWRRIRGGT